MVNQYTVNANKILHLAVASYAGDNMYPDSFDNWRTLCAADGIDLFMDNTTVSFSYTNNFEQSLEKLVEQAQQGILGKVEKLSKSVEAWSAARGKADTLGDDYKSETSVGATSKFLSEWTKFPSWKDTTALSFPDALKINFSYGQNNLFDAKREVINPIFDLFKLFSPQQQSGNEFSGLVPSSAYLTAFMATTGIKKLSEGSSSSSTGSTGTAVTSDSSSGTDVSALTRGISTVYSILDSSALTLAKQSSTKLAYFKLGHLRWGPCVIGTVKPSFDYTQVDSNGYPYKGSIELSGIVSIKMATNSLISSMLEGSAK